MNSSSPTTDLLRDIAGNEELTIFVSGPCMDPVLPDGSRIHVRRKRWYWPGDVVAFRRSDGRLLVHRTLGYAVGRRGLALLAKGDRLAREDEPVSLTHIVGRVVGGDCRREAFEVPLAVRIRCIFRYIRTLLRCSLGSWSSANAS